MLLSLASSLLMALTASSGLDIDGKTSVTRLMATPVQVHLTGTPGLPAYLLLDTDPGPSLVQGVSIPIGFSSSFRAIPLGDIPAGGTLEVEITLPNVPSLHQQVIYGAGVVLDPAFPGGLDVSNQVQITLMDRNMELAGHPLSDYPNFEYSTAFNEGDPIGCAVETSRYPYIIGRTGDVYLVAAKTRAEWIADPSLTDVGSGPITRTFVAGPISANAFLLDPGTLSGDAGADVGVGYDVVIDLNQDGELNEDDFIDGYADEAGLYVVADLTQPGPYTVVETQYSGGSWLDQDLYYPSNIASLGQVPLIVISHGNGHNYRWYDHLGNHMASYGFVVMSHSNNTSPGIFSASTTTLTNTDYFLGNLGSIAGGILDGHIDDSRITWLGHSRGGEGVVLAYDRVFDGSYVPTEFTIDDIKLVSSIAPTGFQPVSAADPHAVTYHVWTGMSDSDVSGCANTFIVWTFPMHDRAQEKRLSISLKGVGHGDFHDGGGSSWAQGPCLVGRPTTHTIMRGYFLPLVKHVIDDNIPSRDYLWRQWESFRAIGSPSTSQNACVDVDLQYRNGSEEDRLIIDDFQTNSPTNISSSGGNVSFSVVDVAEGRPGDPDSNFTYSAGETWNGFTYATTNDTGRHMIFEYSADSFLSFEVRPALQDVSRFDYLSFRAAQAPRHPFTISVLDDQVFQVTLRDTAGTTSTISIDAYGGGIEEPYQRTGCGTGVGWGAEYETIRMRLTDFLHDGSGLDLCRLESITFQFGPSFGTAEGRLGFDDLQFHAE
ncbi:MAG: poly(ethylene terephthalate) hydrolase family protein [Planctomycetota bacterium]